MTLLQRLGILGIAMVLSGVLGAFAGYRYATGQEATLKAEKLETTLPVINDQVKEDTQLIQTQVIRRTQKIKEVKQIETQGVMDASLKANTFCGWDTESYGLLLRAIDTANGSGDSSRLSATVSSSAQTRESLGSGASSVDVSNAQ